MRYSDGQKVSQASACVLGLSFFGAVVFGAQTEDWSWGPALLLLGFAVAVSLALPKVVPKPSWVALSLALASLWILLRVFQSPVIDGARADGLLVLALVACAWITGRLPGGVGALRLLYIALAISALANVAMAVAQSQNPEVLWPYSNKPSEAPTGFFGHYNYFANYVGGVGLLCLCRAAFCKDSLLARTLFLFAFLGAAALIPLSGSRGGTVAMVAGIFLILVSAGVLAWRNRSKWSTVFLVALPILLLGGMASGGMMLKDVQEHRGHRKASEGISAIADNHARLQWLELAQNVATNHPLQGGGSRSFSWERNHKWDVDHMGRGTENERFVHNELAQTITDYGLVGACLVVLAIGAMMWRGVVRLFLGGDSEGGGADASAAGVIAAGGMMLVQSNVSFVFHLLPSTMLLGVLFGLAMRLGRPSKSGERDGGGKRLTGLIIALPLLGCGLVGTWTLRTVWPVLYGDRTLGRETPDQEMERLAAAARWWPGYRLAEEQGRVARLEAVAQASNPESSEYWNSRAAEAFGVAANFHPYHPGFQVNQGNILSELGRDEEAEAAFVKAVELQGGLESGFRARLCYAQHLYRKWYQIWQTERRSSEALHEFLRARDLLDQSDAQSLWGYDDSKAIRKSLEQVIQFLEGGRVVPVKPKEE